MKKKDLVKRARILRKILKEKTGIGISLPASVQLLKTYEKKLVCFSESIKDELLKKRVLVWAKCPCGDPQCYLLKFNNIVEDLLNVI